MKTSLSLLLGFVCLAAAPCSTKADVEKFYYWVTPRSFSVQDESFVVEVDAAIKAQIEELFAQNHEVGVIGQIASGAAAYNKDYFKPGSPVWNWHFVSVDRLRDFTEFPIDTTHVWPNRDDSPSRIAINPDEWIQANGNAYLPKGFRVAREVNPNLPVAMANVSNRGVAGTGDKTLITGLIITGGEPRNIVVRALGPSLRAAGLEHVATNPKIEVYRDSRLVAANTDWKSDRRANALNAMGLAPVDDKEAAVLLTLVAGSYTLHGSNEDGTEGVMLLEAYDADRGSD